MKTTDIEICGYPCELHEFESGWVSVSVPMGENEYDKKMFDTLVYYKQKVYNGKDKAEVIQKVEEWIINYKAQNEKS